LAGDMLEGTKKRWMQLGGAFDENEFRDIAKQFSGLIGLKNEAEYRPDLMKGSQASDALRRASRILSKVRQKLP